nr:MAG TPA: hypothetical protein [Bacteriophage sp.]
MLLLISDDLPLITWQHSYRSASLLAFRSATT